jgi:hypothetical protein
LDLPEWHRANKLPPKAHAGSCEKRFPYIPRSKRIKLGGTVKVVKVVAVVAADGEVKSVEPEGGSPILLKAAEDAVAKWKFASGGESREIIEVRFAP